MVTMLMHVVHDRCALCGEDAPLFVLSLMAGERAHIEPKPDDTHTGVCRPCWTRMAWEILAPSTYQGADVIEDEDSP